MSDREEHDRTQIALALGSGSARGWAHIGVIRELERLGIVPDIVCGSSVGAIVGASYVAGNLDRLEDWVRSLTRIRLARYFDVNLSLNGFVDRQRLQEFFEDYVCARDALFEDQRIRFATVSTDLETGKEVWFHAGPMLDSVWASVALPGLFPPIRYGEHWLVDGGLVNPVPVSVCRALGADSVIAVNLNGDVVGRHFTQNEPEREDVLSRFRKNIKAYATTLFGRKSVQHAVPSLFDAISGSINIAQDRITRSRMAGDPPDVLLAPRLSHIGLLEFHRAGEAIDEGAACVRRMTAELRHVVQGG